MFVTNQFGVRMTYQAAAAAMAASGIKAQVSKCTQSYLRSEIPLTTSTNQYQVPILVNNNPYGQPNSTEKRLQLQDAFIVGAFGVFLAVPASAAAYAGGAFLPLTYPSLAKFTAAEQVAMMALYNGSMSLMVGQNTLITAWPLLSHWVANQTLSTGAGILDQNDYTTDGYYPQEPNVVHIGSTNIVMQITLPAAISVLPALPYLVVIQTGILAQNVTSITNS